MTHPLIGYLLDIFWIAKKTPKESSMAPPRRVVAVKASLVLKASDPVEIKKCAGNFMEVTHGESGFYRDLIGIQ